MKIFTQKNELYSGCVFTQVGTKGGTKVASTLIQQGIKR
jgi:hypothetical protein